MYSLTCSEDQQSTSLKSGCRLDHAPSNGFKGESVPHLLHFLVAPGVPRLVAPVSVVTLSLPLRSQNSLCLMFIRRYVIACDLEPTQLIQDKLLL